MGAQRLTITYLLTQRTECATALLELLDEIRARIPVLTTERPCKFRTLRHPPSVLTLLLDEACTSRAAVIISTTLAIASMVAFPLHNLVDRIIFALDVALESRDVIFHLRHPW